MSMGSYLRKHSMHRRVKHSGAEAKLKVCQALKEVE